MDRGLDAERQKGKKKKKKKKKKKMKNKNKKICLRIFQKCWSHFQILGAVNVKSCTKE